MSKRHSEESLTDTAIVSSPDPPNQHDGSFTSLSNIVVIESRNLIGDCLAQCLRLSAGPNVEAFSSVEKWLESSHVRPASLIILCASGKSVETELNREMALLEQSGSRVPTVVISDVEDLDQIVDALDHGVRGYIPTSVPWEVVIGALQLVKAGGTYVPVSSVFAAKHSTSAGKATEYKRFCNGMFTARQATVVEALRRGKANKVIAYELKMRESTVKVHIRSIMKKLNAKNRTEVAFIANGLIEEEMKLRGRK